MENSSGQLALVTGASSGIGLELAKLFATHGYDLVIVAEDDGINTAAETLRSLGPIVESVQADLATREGVEKPLAARGSQRSASRRHCDQRWRSQHGGPFPPTDLEDEINLMTLNITGAVHSRQIRATADGRTRRRPIFDHPLIAAEMPAPFEAVYSARRRRSSSPSPKHCGMSSRTRRSR